jgi:UDPglucose 6-dehydrogenase
MSVNERQKVKLVEMMEQFFKEGLAGKNVALWGLSFKPHTDDIREAPALYIIELLKKKGATVRVHDPEAMENVKRVIGNSVEYGTEPYDILDRADALLIATEWPEYRTPDFEKMASLMKRKVIFDGRNLYDIAMIRELGFTYFSIGRKQIVQ